MWYRLGWQSGSARIGSNARKLNGSDKEPSAKAESESKSELEKNISTLTISEREFLKSLLVFA